jgi:sialate O-acetylesterase
VFERVAGLDGYSLLYRVQLPVAGARFAATGAPYAFDGSAALVAPFTRVGWYLELEEDNAPPRFVYVEADAFDADPARLGFPTSFVLQQDLANGRVESNVDGVVTGAGRALNAELWPSDYGESNDAAPSSPASADDALYDFGDGGADASPGHGSFQLHDTAAGRTLFAINDWASAQDDVLAIGIGNQPTGQPDWTFAGNAASFTVKTLEIVVDAPLASPALPSTLPPPTDNITARVPAEEIAGYALVYDVDLPEAAAFNTSAVPYSVDESASVPPGSFDRVAWYLELDDGAQVQWIWVSVAAFTLDAGRIGIPTTSSGAFFQHVLRDGRVFSNVVAEGTALAGLNIEFWPTNYREDNTLPIASADALTFDFGDMPTAGGYGSMQIHDGAAGHTLFAYNHWGNGGATPSDLGIGDSPAGNPDWTFEGNAPTYVARRLQVLVHAR